MKALVLKAILEIILHWYGLSIISTNHMDGRTYVTGWGI